jgi:hypothetical protein
MRSEIGFANALSQFQIIVYLPIVGDDIPTLCDHWLSTVGNINNAQSCVPEGDISILTPPDALAVRATVPLNSVHLLQHISTDVRRVVAISKEARYSAHKFLSETEYHWMHVKNNWMCNARTVF